MTKDPFKIYEPTCIAFSGGRTSGYMLWRVLESNGGLPDNAVVVFANTGKEEEATLQFVQDCASNWNIPIVWLEWREAIEPENKFAIVDVDTASRDGEPFEALIRKRNYLPNPIARFCTVELKVLTCANYCRYCLGWDEWDNFVGIRADEPKRVAKIRDNPSGGTKGIFRLMPLVNAGVNRHDVAKFWSAQKFDLGLPNVGGVTYHGNCDLCFLKNASQILSLISEKPQRALWWIHQENSITNARLVDGGYFRKDRPSYSAMLQFTKDQRDFFWSDEAIEDCFCGG